MPYKTNADLPEGVHKHLPEHAQLIYREAFNHALIEYQNSEKRRDDATLEAVSHKVAWHAVKNKYEKDDKSGNWKAK